MGNVLVGLATDLLLHRFPFDREIGLNATRPYEHEISRLCRCSPGAVVRAHSFARSAMAPNPESSGADYPRIKTRVCPAISRAIHYQWINLRRTASVDYQLPTRISNTEPRDQRSWGLDSVRDVAPDIW